MNNYNIQMHVKSSDKWVNVVEDVCEKDLIHYKNTLNNRKFPYRIFSNNFGIVWSNRVNC